MSAYVIWYALFLFSVDALLKAVALSAGKYPRAVTFSRPDDVVVLVRDVVLVVVLIRLLWG